VGEVAFRSRLMRAPFGRPYPVTVRTGFLFRDKRIELVRLHATGPGLEARLDGRLLLTEDAALAAEGRVDADLGLIAPWLREGMPELAGRVGGDVVLDLRHGALHLRGPVEGRAIHLGPLRLASARGQAHVVPGLLTLRQVQALGYGGAVSGSVDVSFGETVRFSSDLAARDLDAEALLDLAHLPLPLSAVARTTFRLAGEPGDVSTWSGGGEFVTERGAPHGERVPVGATGSFTLDAGRLRLQGTEVEAAALRAGMDLDVDLGRSPARGWITVSGSTSDAAITQAGTLVLLRALDVDPGELAREPLQGHGSVRARIGLGGSADLDLALQLSRGSWAGRPFDEAALGLTLRGSRLEIHDLAMAFPRGRLAGTLALDTASPGPRSRPTLSIPTSCSSSSTSPRGWAGLSPAPCRWSRGPRESWGKAASTPRMR
jgi:hypothetical protein